MLYFLFNCHDKLKENTRKTQDRENDNGKHEKHKIKNTLS